VSKKGFDRFMNPNGGRKRSASQEHKDLKKFRKENPNMIISEIEWHYSKLLYDQNLAYDLMMVYGYTYEEACKLIDPHRSKDEEE
jgi:hypothetical protein